MKKGISIGIIALFIVTTVSPMVIGFKSDVDKCLMTYGRDNSPPNAPTIDGPTCGKVGKSYNYTFNATDPDNEDISYYVDWGDNTTTGWLEYVESGTPLTLNHTWYNRGTFIITARFKDINGQVSDWAYLEVTMPKNQQADNMWFLRWLERFPILQKILDVLRLNIR